MQWALCSHAGGSCERPHTCVTAGEGDTVDQGMGGQVVSDLTSPPCSRHA